MASSSSMNGGDNSTVDIKFSHVQLYVDAISPLNEYKILEDSLNKFHESFNKDDVNDDVTTEHKKVDIDKGRRLWKSMQGMSNDDSAAFLSHGRDVVKVSY